MKFKRELSLTDNRHVKGMYWESSDAKLAFIGVPKCASCTIRDSLGISEAKNVGNYLTPEGASRIDGHLKFTAFRHPIDRFMSAYLEIIGRYMEDMPETREKKFYKMPESKGRFVEFVSEIERGYYEIHTVPQMHYITNGDGELFDFDQIILLDDFKDGFSKLCIKAGISKFIQNKNVKEVSKKNMIKSYLDDDLIKRINHLYREDLEFYKQLKNKNYEPKIK
jgi:hypothetical protein